jgi:Trk-type K+ transport system membrane component
MKWELADDQKSKIDREDTATWFNVFNIIFELVSAYGTVGLSLGSPIANYS